MKKRIILKLVFTVWVALWMFFLLREDKDGQYRSLEYLYTHDHADDMRYIIGKDLYGFLVFCRRNIPDGSTYELEGFGEFSIEAERARYFLWPLKRTGKVADYKVVFGGGDAEYPGYAEYKRFGGTGRILKKEGKSG